jgi:hypothetical protein
VAEFHAKAQRREGVWVAGGGWRGERGVKGVKSLNAAVMIADAG